jgi:hypothetical protein
MGSDNGSQRVVLHHMTEFLSLTSNYSKMNNRTGWC